MYFIEFQLTRELELYRYSTSMRGFYATLAVGAALTFENVLLDLRHQMAPAQWPESNVKLRPH